MKTKNKDLYDFEELSEEAKRDAMTDYATINVDGVEWWECTYDTFDEVGIRIDCFDLYSYNLCFDLTLSIEEVCKNIINKIGFDWAEMCQDYLDSVNAQLALEPVDQDMLEDMEALFLKDLELDILGWLNDEYIHLRSDEEVKFALANGDYKFDINGNIIEGIEYEK